jgi:AcrR family transcriptional regulator
MLSVVSEVNPERRPASQPTRRDRARAATRAEIVAAARALLVEGGVEQVTLRRIAAALGMTAPALYRYFDSRELLLGALCNNIYDELADALFAARDADPDAGLKHRFLVTSHAFRAWALGHRPEFGLLFGAPIPGVLVDAAAGTVPDDELWREHPGAVPGDDQLDPGLREQLLAYHEQINGIVPIGAIALYLSGWMRLYGAVATEAFGHLDFALAGGNAEVLFADLMQEIAERLGLKH